MLLHAVVAEAECDSNGLVPERRYRREAERDAAESPEDNSIVVDVQRCVVV